MSITTEGTPAVPALDVSALIQQAQLHAEAVRMVKVARARWNAALAVAQQLYNEEVEPATRRMEAARDALDAITARSTRAVLGDPAEPLRQIARDLRGSSAPQVAP